MENENGANNKNNNAYSDVNGTLSERANKWVSGSAGGLVGGILAVLFVVVPVINTWLSNTKEVSLAQIKNSADQIEYITKRMIDSDKERDLYKQEMIQCQAELRKRK